MKQTTLLLILLTLISCKQRQSQTKDAETEVMIEESEADKSQSFPENLEKVFEAHGGLTHWKAYRTLTYRMPKDINSELHTTDLYNRKDRVETEAFAMGFDGKNVWLADANNAYTGDPVFYHNLMFYFFAMPFILADNGIIYSETEDLIFEGKKYPGIAISYEIGIGTSYKDEYFLHYDPETFEMKWLGYTVTYRSGEKSENVKWIRYDDWAKVGQVVLPKSLTWYNYEGREIRDARSTVHFDEIQLSKEAKPSSFYQMPADAKVVEGKKQV